MTITLSELNVYPLKSTRGLSVEVGYIERRGLRDDRRWMLIDSADRYLTQRQHPRLTLVDVTVSDSGLVVSSGDRPNVSVPRGGGAAIWAQIWHDRVAVEHCATGCDEWFTRYLGIDCRVVYMPEGTRRPVNPTYAASDDDTVSFADGFPLHLLSQESLDELNRRLEKPVTMRRFRPNIVVRGCAAHDEDTWNVIRIGDVEFDVVKPCKRCTIPTVDLATGKPGKEPLRTLATYRRRDRLVLFGQNLIPRKAGTVRLGQAVEVLV
ncbi:MAG: MOSC domain-containing protein [Proteobacteria bacterium]|nr:MOSC domain-containing protein [Pseudomonadota bacterium]